VEVKGHNGTIEFDGRSVTIKRKGMLARVTSGKGEKQIPLASITAVQWKPAGAMVDGFIQFALAGAIESEGRAGSATSNAGKYENSVLFTKRQMPQFEELRRAIEMARDAPAPEAPSAAAPSVADRMRQLTQLRDDGLITEGEFETKRREILSEM